MAAQTSLPAGADVIDGVPAAEAAEAVHGQEAPHGSTEVAGHGEGGGGLPQFQFEHWAGQIIWLILIFAVLYALLAKVFVPKLRKIIDTRAETIAAAVADARKVQAEAESQAAAAKAEVEQARGQSRSLASDAKAKAAAELAKSQAAEDDRLAGEMATAEARIREMRDAAMTNVRGIAVETAQAMVEKLTGAPASAESVEAAMAARTAQGAA